MFKEIYDYAKQHIDDVSSAYKEKYIKYHICLDKDGNFIGIEINEDKKNKKLVPCYPERVTYGDTPNFLIANYDVIFGKENKKTAKYIQDLSEASKYSSLISKIYAFIIKINSDDKFPDDWFVTEKDIKEHTKEYEKVAKELVSFRIDTDYIEDSNEWKEYFQNRYNELYSAGKDEKEMISCISGQKIRALKNLDKVSVGGCTTSTGDVIACADKPAFQHYGLSGAFNSAMSEEESAYVAKGLERLLQKDHYDKNFNLAHWYKEDVLKEDDIVSLFLSPDLFFNIENNKGENVAEDKDYLLSKKMRMFFEVKERATIDNNTFYFLRYTPCGGRMCLSDFKTGSTKDLFTNINNFYKDSELLISNFGASYITNLYSMLKNICYNPEKTNSIESELSHIKPRLLDAIIENKQLPFEVYVRALRNTKRLIVNSDKTKKPNRTLYKIIKTYLVRKNKLNGKEIDIMPALNKDNVHIGYLCGRLLAVYAKIQNDALGDVNTGIIDKYYMSCSQTPAFAFGALNKTLNYHLKKVEQKNTGLAIKYRKLLQEIYSKINELPKKIDIIEQGYFAIGYFQQQQDFYTKVNESDKIDEKKGE